MEYTPQRSWTLPSTNIVLANDNAHFLYFAVPTPEDTTDIPVLFASESHIEPTATDGWITYKVGILQGVIAGKRKASMLWGNAKETTADYTLPLAASGTRGGLQIGFTEAGANLPVLLSSEKAYIALTGLAIQTVLTGLINTHYHDYDNYLDWKLGCFGQAFVAVNAQTYIQFIPGTGVTLVDSLTGGATAGAPRTITINSTGDYTLPLATSTVRGGLKIGYTASAENLPLLLSAEKAYIALTKAAIEAVLTGALTSHTHNYDNYNGWVILTDEVGSSKTINTGQNVKFGDSTSIGFSKVESYGVVNMAAYLMLQNLPTITNPTTSHYVAVVTDAAEHSKITLATLKTLIAGTITEDREWGFADILAGTVQTYDVDVYASWAYTINKFILVTNTGTLTSVGLYINGVAVTGCTGLTASGTRTAFTPTAAKTVAIGDRVTLVVAATFTGAPTYLGGKIELTRS